MDIFQSALELHQKLRGKLSVENRFDVCSKEDLSLVYSPGVAAACEANQSEPS